MVSTALNIDVLGRRVPPSTPVGYMAQPGSAAYSDYPKPTPTGADAYPLGPGPYPCPGLTARGKLSVDPVAYGG